MRAGAQVMRIAPTESNIAPKQYETQRHKPPTKKYYVKAPEVQIDYNAYKCKADQFNKAIHEYTHIGMPVNDEVTFTQKFIAVFTQQAYTYYNFTAENKISQLDFHESLVKEPIKKLVWQKSSAPLCRNKNVGHHRAHHTKVDVNISTAGGCYNYVSLLLWISCHQHIYRSCDQ